MRGTDPFEPNAPPTLQAVASIQVIQGVETNLTVRALDSDGNLRRLEVRESLEDDQGQKQAKTNCQQPGRETLIP